MLTDLLFHFFPGRVVSKLHDHLIVIRGFSRYAFDFFLFAKFKKLVFQFHDRITVDFSLKKAAFAEYEASFGYYKRDIAEIDEWHRNARDGAYKFAVKARKGQADLDRAMANLQKEREARVKAYMTGKGFKFLPGNVVSVDVPARPVSANSSMAASRSASRRS